MSTAPRNVAVLVGSLRKASYSRRVAQAVIAMAPPALAMRIVEIGDLPLYNQDLETASPPPAWTTFREAIRSADALLFVTPEYNRSMPGALKNAIDVGSRPPGSAVWNGKPAGVISVTPGAIGAFGANHALRQSLMAVGVAAMPLPEMYIGGAATLLDDAGQFTNDKTRELFAKFVAALEKWVGTQLSARTS
jgi:chromate reductase